MSEHPTTQQLQRDLARILADPHETLVDELETCDLSSQEISRGADVPASVVRSIRNRTAGSCLIPTWAKLMSFLLSHNRGWTWLPTPQLEAQAPAPREPGEKRRPSNAGGPPRSARSPRRKPTVSRA